VLVVEIVTALCVGGGKMELHCIGGKFFPAQRKIIL